MNLGMTAMILMTGTALAQTSPTVIRNDQYGVHYTVPTAWNAQAGEIGHVLTSPSHDGALLVFIHNTTTMAEAIRMNAEPFVYKNTINMSPLRPAQVVSPTKLSVDLEGTWVGKPARARLLVLLSPHGGAGLAILSGTSTSSFGPEYVSLAETVARSAQFTKVDTGAAANSWTGRLAGKKLHYFTRYNGGSGGGMAGHKELGLCSDGSFFLRGDFSASIYSSGATGTTANRSSNTGAWKVQNGVDPKLVLLFENGSQATYTLSLQDGKTFLNNQRWLSENATECR